MDEEKYILPQNEILKHKPIKELSIIDDFLFQELMLSDKFGKEFLSYFLKTILGTDITSKEIQAQSIRTAGDTNTRAIRLDVVVDGQIADSFAESSIKKLEKKQNMNAGSDIQVDVEMQKQAQYVTAGQENCLRRRSRLYQALVDVKLLKTGETMDAMKEVPVIICCSYDLFGRNRMKYTFEHRCVEEPDLVLEDGAKRIFLNTKGQKGATKELQDMLHYIETSNEINVTSEALQNIHNIINSVKSDKEVEARYMLATINDLYLKRESRKEGILLGKKVIRLETQGLSPDEIAVQCGISVEEVNEILSE